jgi:hypothetical protein
MRCRRCATSGHIFRPKSDVRLVAATWGDTEVSFHPDTTSTALAPRIGSDVIFNERMGRYLNG